MQKHWKTKLIHSDAKAPDGFRSLNSPVCRASTTLFRDAAAVTDAWDQYESGYTYGLYGTPTTLEWAARGCELEGGFRSIVTPGGQNAIALINFALLRAGDHVLLPESVYGPNRKLGNDVLRRFGVEVSYYDPTIGSAIAHLVQPNTRVVWCESPGSISMEVQDVPAIANAAHAAGVLVAMDNTWSAGVYFDALAHGVDVTVQALTKYVGGHSDLLLGSVTTKDKSIYQRLGATHQLLGAAASPDDCSLALRRMKTLAVRLEKVEASSLTIAQWLAARPEVERVLHPALASCPGHEIWQRDFTGSSGIFSIVLREGVTREQVFRFVNSLELFKIGYSWGGVTSLALAYDFGFFKNRPSYGHRIVRLNIGIEVVDDLLSDLGGALHNFNAP